MVNPNELLLRIESSRLWSHFHKDWLIAMRGLVRAQLPKEYSVFVESEAMVVTPLGTGVAAILPDVSVVRDTRNEPGPTNRSGANAALLEVEELCELQTQYSLIVRRAPEEQFVAACELLSPTNKGVHGSLEKERYLRKREQYLLAGVNLLEIDALVGGERLLPLSVSGLASYERSAWTTLHRGDRRRWRGWGWNAQEPLPTVAWSIEEQVDVNVDLAASIRAACEFNEWDRLASAGKP